MTSNFRIRLTLIVMMVLLYAAAGYGDTIDITKTVQARPDAVSPGIGNALSPLSDSNSNSGTTDVPFGILSGGGASSFYIEDFNDGLAQYWKPTNSTLWDVVSGEYRARAMTSYVYLQSIYTGDIWTDCSVQATTRSTGVTYFASVIVLRASPDFNWSTSTGSAYLFGIVADGSYYVAKYVYGALYFIQGWITSPYLNTGTASNVVKASINGSTIRVFFNGHLAWAGSDSSIMNAGNVELMGFSGYYDDNLTIHYFDDIIVDKPMNFSENFDTNPGWTTQGQWEFGQPLGLGGLYHGRPDPTNGYTGSNVYGVNLSGDYSTSVGGPYYLTTNPINCTNVQTVELKFMRWLNSDYQPYVKNTVDVSSDGSSWTNIWQNGYYEIADSSWVQCEYDISTVAANQSTVYVRWGYEVSNGAYAYSGWNIDDVQVNPSGNWWMFRQDRQHTGRSIFNGPALPCKKWEFATGYSIDSSPTIGSDGTIYVGSYDYKLYAINPNGSKKWNFTTGSYVFSSPAIGSDGTIYVGSYDNNLYAINSDGSEKWKFATGYSVASSPAIGSDGTIYVGSYDGKLYAINPNGTKKWEFATGSYVFSSPAIGSDGAIYVSSDSGKLYAINPINGLKNWEFATGSYVYSSPAVGADGTIYIGSNDNKLYAINPINGSKKWEFTTGGYIWSSPAIGSDGTIYVGSNDNKLYALNPTNGSKKWEFATGSWVGSSPAIGSDGTIYVGSYDNKLYAINPYDRSKKWEFATGNGMYSSPAIGSDGTIYVGSMDNKLYAISKGLTGKISLSDYTGNITIVPITIELNGISYNLNLDANGRFSIADVADGIYDIRIKASHWLIKVVYGVNVAGSTDIGTVFLINGDVVENNEVDFSDINAVRAAYGSFPGDETWNERADVDGSGEVDFTDINIVRSRYGEIGD